MADWRIRYGTVDYRFGGGWPLLFDVAPEVEFGESDAADVRSANSDGVLMGSDLFGSGRVAFQIDIADPEGGESGAKRLLDELRGVWRADSIRRTPGAVAQLWSEWGRVAFGRPRRFAPGLFDVRRGFVPVVADFSLVSDVWYGVEQSESFTFASPSGGGLLAPLASPLSTTLTSDRSQVITVGGDLATQHVIWDVQGPITNPVIEVVGVGRLEFLTTLAYDQTLRVDARPWVRTITVGSATRAGTLTPASTSLSRFTLPPGRHEVVLRGADSTGTSSLRTRWRDAFTTP